MSHTTAGVLDFEEKAPFRISRLAIDDEARERPNSLL